MRTSTPVLSQILDEVKKYEINKDYETQRDILKGLWSDLNEDPPIENLTPVEKAEVWRVCGHFLSNYGRAKGLSGVQLIGLNITAKGCQERGKDMLIRAVDIFTDVANASNDFAERAAEAKCKLALCYWNEGDRDNAAGVLHESLLSFPDTKSEIHLQIQIHRLIVLYYSDEFPECLRIIQRFKSQVDKTASDRVKLEFYNQAGIIFRKLEDHDRAIECYSVSLRLSKKLESLRLTAQILNNLAFAYHLKGDSIKSFRILEESIKLCRSLGDSGFLANVLDTKANVEMSLGENEQALVTIEESINILRNCEDAASFADSYWTKTEILLCLDRVDEAIDCHYELRQSATAQISQYKVEQYNKMFAERLSVRGRKPSPASTQIYEPTQKIENAPECDYLVFVPAEQAQTLNSKTAVVVSVKYGKTGDVFLAVVSPLELIVTRIFTDKTLEFLTTYVLKNGEPVLDFQLIGAVTSIARFDEKVLRFEPI